MAKTHLMPDFGDKDFWMNEWLKSGRRKSQHTHLAYRQDVDSFLYHTGKMFDKISVTDILDYQSVLMSESKSERTVARKISSIRSFYRFLNNREITNLNLARIESAKIEQSVDHDKLLTVQEVQAMIEAAKPDRDGHIFVRFLYLTAVRISEALKLRWRDLTPLKDGGEAHIVGKGRKRRNVFIPGPLWDDLIDLRGASPSDGFLFPFNYYAGWQLIKKLAKAAKIEKDVSPHSFRHAHISHALVQGATLAELRDQAGHSNISTTSLYAHASSEKATATRLKVQ